MIITASTPVVKCEYPAQEESPRTATTLVGPTEIKRVDSERYVVFCFAPVGTLSDSLISRLIGTYKLTLKTNS